MIIACSPGPSRSRDVDRFVTAVSLVSVTLGITPAAAAGDAVADDVSTAAQWIPYGTLDAMVYRFRDDSGVQRTWNLNGLRETLLGIKSGEPTDGSNDWRPVAQFEIAFGADRGERGREYTVAVKQTFAGIAGPWGQLTVGRQENVMSNIAWSALNPIGNGWGIYFNDLLYLGDSFTYRNENAYGVAGAGSNWFFGYQQVGAAYNFKGEGFSVQADFIPGGSSSELRRGTTVSIGATTQWGPWMLAGAVGRQASRDGSTDRLNHVIGGVYTWDKVKLYLSRMQSTVSNGAHYRIIYGGAGWQVQPKTHLSFAVAQYRQNAAAYFGSGSSRGASAVAEYSVTPQLNTYIEADYRRHSGGSDGAQANFATPGAERNVMVGLSTSF